MVQYFSYIVIHHGNHSIINRFVLLEFFFCPSMLCNAMYRIRRVAFCPNRFVRILFPSHPIMEWHVRDVVIYSFWNIHIFWFIHRCPGFRNQIWVMGIKETGPKHEGFIPLFVLVKKGNATFCNPSVGMIFFWHFPRSVLSFRGISRRSTIPISPFFSYLIL